MRGNLNLIVGFVFILSGLGPLPGQAQEFVLPKPGEMVNLSPAFSPAILKGIKVNTTNPLRFDFVLDQGERDPGNVIASPVGAKQSQQEQLKLIKYFLAGLTIPENDLWVNLSPYEKNRIVPGAFGQTQMGRDLLAEDYILKQITASLIYPEGETGKKFWKRVYEEAAQKFNTTNIPVNTFNKVWIVPEKAVVYENAKTATAYIVQTKLKVMLEQDYLALKKSNVILSSAPHEKRLGAGGAKDPNKLNALGSQIVREIVIPELTKEVNQGKNFSQLRQIYNSLILATWYKKKIKDSILAQVYENKNKVKGLSYLNEKNLSSPHKSNLSSPNAFVGDPQYIYQQYLKAFKKGVFNYIKEEQGVPKKYFSGGALFTQLSMDKALEIITTKPTNPDNAQLTDLTVDMAMAQFEKQEKWSSKENAVAHIRSVLELKIPDIMLDYYLIDTLSPKEIEKLRERIYEITLGNFREWGLRAVTNKKYTFFNGSHISALAAVFDNPRLGFSEEGMKQFRIDNTKKVFFWGSEDEGIENVRKKIEENEPDLLERYGLLDAMTPEEIDALRKDIYKISFGTFRSWGGLNSALNQEQAPYFEGSYITVLQKVFRRLNLERSGFEDKAQISNGEIGERRRSLEHLLSTLEHSPNDLPIVMSIGDLHGDPRDLRRAFTTARKTTKEMWIIVQGDLFDRGPDNRKNFYYIKELHTLSTANPKIHLVLLLGNHEQMMIQAVLTRQREYVSQWLIKGGAATLEQLENGAPKEVDYLDGHHWDELTPSLKKQYMHRRDQLLEAQIQYMMSSHHMLPALTNLVDFIVQHSDFIFLDAWGFLHKHTGIPMHIDTRAFYTLEELEKIQAEWVEARTENNKEKILEFLKTHHENLWEDQWDEILTELHDYSVLRQDKVAAYLSSINVRKKTAQKPELSRKINGLVIAHEGHGNRVSGPINKERGRMLNVGGFYYGIDMNSSAEMKPYGGTLVMDPEVGIYEWTVPPKPDQEGKKIFFYPKNEWIEHLQRNIQYLTNLDRPDANPNYIEKIEYQFKVKGAPEETANIPQIISLAGHYHALLEKVVNNAGKLLQKMRKGRNPRPSDYENLNKSISELSKYHDFVKASSKTHPDPDPHIRKLIDLFINTIVLNVMLRTKIFSTDWDLMNRVSSIYILRTGPQKGEALIILEKDYEKLSNILAYFEYLQTTKHFYTIDNGDSRHPKQMIDPRPSLPGWSYDHAMRTQDAAMLPTNIEDRPEYAFKTDGISRKVNNPFQIMNLAKEYDGFLSEVVINIGKVLQRIKDNKSIKKRDLVALKKSIKSLDAYHRGLKDSNDPVIKLFRRTIMSIYILETNATNTDWDLMNKITPFNTLELDRLPNDNKLKLLEGEYAKLRTILAYFKFLQRTDRLYLINIPKSKAAKETEKVIDPRPDLSTAPKNKAMLVHNGGIDLSQVKIDAQTKDWAIRFHLDAAQLAQLQNAAGFIPVIVSAKPITDLQNFL
jgi:hypothetical protein